jgi:hypothetical protein
MTHRTKINKPINQVATRRMARLRTIQLLLRLHHRITLHRHRIAIHLRRIAKLLRHTIQLRPCITQLYRHPPYTTAPHRPHTTRPHLLTVPHHRNIVLLPTLHTVPHTMFRLPSPAMRQALVLPWLTALIPRTLLTLVYQPSRLHLLLLLLQLCARNHQRDPPGRHLLLSRPMYRQQAQMDHP